MELKKKVALITGAGQGLGREMAKVLAAEGALVAVNDLFQERADEVAQEIEKLGGQALGVQADVTDLSQVQAMFAKTKQELGPVGILVNNAGVPWEVRSGKIARTDFLGNDPSYWQMQINLNLYGCLHCCHSALKDMIANRDGKIVSVISEAGRTGQAGLAVYAAAKAGVLAFSKSLAKEVGKHAINVNCIAVGATAHEGTKPALDPDATPETDEKLAKMLRVYPVGRGLGRIGRPWDAAYAVAFLSSPKSCFITGQCLSVSGGFNMVS